MRIESLIRDQFEFDNMLYTDGAYEDECCIYEGAQNELGWDLGCKDTDGKGRWPPGDTCLQGVKISGSFYVVLYTQNPTGEAERRCLIRNKDFGRREIVDLISGYKEIYKFAIIPKGF